MKKTNLQSIRKDFPALRDKSLAYLDSSATALKPQAVIDAVTGYYADYGASIARGLYPMAEKATAKYYEARETIGQFLGASSSDEIIFVRNATEAINLVAYSWGRINIEKDDEIITTIMEHHSNFVPWQVLAAENGALLKVLDIDGDGRLDTRVFLAVTRKTKLVCLTHVSNVLGTINPINKIIKGIKRRNSNCLVLIDGAQAVPHMKVNVQDLGCDFYAFSGHKMMGPTGIGVLWAKKNMLKNMAPFMFGGGMIERVELGKSTYAYAPTRFEAGTPHIAGAIGLAAAVEYMKKVGVDTIRQHEIVLGKYLLQRLSDLNNLTVYGPRSFVEKAGVFAFNMFDKKGKLIHSHDIGQVLANLGICVRVGHHCAMPLHADLGIPASVRASFHVYNTKKDIDKLIKGLTKAMQLFS